MTTIRNEAVRARADEATRTFAAACSRTLQRTGVAAALLLVAVTAGCASNHAFVRGAEPDVAELVTELEALGDGEGVLFDGVYVPFAHLDVELFAENDEPGYPRGHLLLSMRSWLPLFGIVDGEFTLYDGERSAYERGEFSSVLWGLWSRRQRAVQTYHGERVEKDYGLLWILDFGPDVRYPADARGGASRPRD